MQNWSVPPYVFESLYRYYRHGIPGGDFVMAVVNDKGWESAARADSVNRQHLADILLFNGQASRYHRECKLSNDMSGYDLRWEAWRNRYSPEAHEIAVNLGEEEDD
jgi:hypothetical protein